ncbi:MAG: hypothetical protein IJJ82_01010 [Clostridia bacterium]|nr:hypothetical protein [Clostridia bacterium]
MRKIGFIGAYDKIDMMINVAKVLTECGKKVLVIDSTISQKARYIVPALESTPAYITEFEQIDVAVGFRNLSQIKQYSFVEQEQELPYDIALVDIDNPYNMPGFELQETEKNFFVTSFDLYSLKRGMEILAAMPIPLKLTKILNSKNLLKEENDYLDYLSAHINIKWEREKVYFQLENGDYTVITENQRVNKIKFKKLSTQYKDSIEYISALICDKEIAESQIRKVIREIEKRG